MFENILLAVENNVATIIINRPKSLNSLTVETFQELKDAFVECDKRDDVRVVVLAGTGKSFSSGGDIETFKRLVETGVSFEKMKSDVLLSGEAAYAIRQCMKPTIAMVNGACFGAGLSMALGCDFRIIEPGTKMSTAFINVGFSGDTGAIFLLKEMLGFAKMTELMMTGRVMEADEIIRLGLATQLAEEGTLQEETYKIAQRFAAGPTLSYAHQKKMFWDFFFRDYDLYADHEAEHMASCSQTADFKELVAAFLEKRRPNLTGR